MKFYTYRFSILFSALLILGSVAVEPPPPKLDTKDLQIVPFCTAAKDRKLDPKTKKIFDELKVSVTAGRETRYRISGKKKHEVGDLEGEPVLHLGKLVLAPIANRIGSVNAKLPTVTDVRFYYMCVEYGEGKLKTEHVKLPEKTVCFWTLDTSDGETVFHLYKVAEAKDGKAPTKVTLGKIAVPEDEAKSFGFAATVRWAGNEADLTVTFD
jgi:hypothetical protein